MNLQLNGYPIKIAAPSILCLSMEDTIQVYEKQNVSAQSFCFHPDFFNTAHFSEAQGYMSTSLKIEIGLSLYFKDIVDSFDWEMAQIQLNILGESQQVGVEGLKYAADRGIATVIMEPLRGGYLLNNVPREVTELIRNYPEKRSLAEWCFRWLYNMPEVSVILSGMSNLEQLKDNLKIFQYAEPNCMSDEDENLILKIREAFESQKSIGCTGCRYCMPCPHGVKIPDVFKPYNSYKFMKSNNDRYVYQRVLMPSNSGADQCVSCGICEKQCPQGLKIPSILQQVHYEFVEKRLTR